MINGDDIPNLTDAEWDALGTLLLPTSLGGKTQLGTKIGVKLIALGLVEQFSETPEPWPNDPPWLRLKIKIMGYRMTPRGQLLYCAWADQQHTGPEDE